MELHRGAVVGGNLPAMITGIHDDVHVVDLQIFCNNASVTAIWKANVVQGNESGTWKWPDRSE